MSDIVERLLRYEAETDPEVSRLAADEIEHLRSQLAATERGYKSYRDTAEEAFVLLQELRSLIRARIAGPPVDYDTTHAAVLAWDREWLERAKKMVGYA